VTEALSIDKIVNEVRNVFLATPEVTKLRNTQENKDSNQEITQKFKADQIFANEDLKTIESENIDSLANKDPIERKPNNTSKEELRSENSEEILNSPKEVINEPIQKKPESPEKSNLIIKSITVLKPGFYVQHTARPNKRLTEELKNKYPSLSNALILKLTKTKSDGHFFVLLSGPFTTLDDAKAFTIRQDIPEGTWIRGALGIRPLIMPID
jgi:hypothetical protein